ncbi:MAG: glycoside hydrolase family 3 N-terminal domain-containing protein [Balneolaceae bacterium]|nr:glycoside hydrolase family 3 N-terminal domain-containing protein [Balneolaceae bacterium]
MTSNCYHWKKYNTLLLILGFALFLQTCSSSKKTAKQPKQGIEQESVLANIEKDSTQKLTKASPPEKIEKLSSPIDIDRMIVGMTLREKIGQLFFVDAYGYYKSNDDEAYQELITQIKENHVGGLIFFNGNIYGQSVLINKLQRISKIPLWITQDMEYGAAMRISGTTRFTPAMGVAATQNPDYAYWMGKITAQEAKAVGVHQIFAPVLDINNNPNNPVINVRAFSGNPQMVATYGNRFIEGVESEGLVATAKHFPGHGDTGTDSHISLPVIDYNYSRLDSVELVPFKSAIQNGLQSIMSAHISFPQLSDTPDVPGTLDKGILNRILIDSLRFDGMVVTDGLEMSGISSHFSPGRAVVKALKAGADLMLLSPDEATAINEVVHAVRTGEISESRIEKSVRKLLQWKKQHGLFEGTEIDIDALSAKINTRKNRVIADEIARGSTTLLRNKNNILPIRPSKFPEVLLISVADDESGNTGSYLARRIRDYHPNVNFHVFDNRSSEEEKQAMLKDAQDASLIIIGSFIYVRSGQPVQLDNDQLNFLKKLPSDKPKALLAFGNPYVVHDLPKTDVQLLAWSANSDQIRNTAPALFGGASIHGRLPIEIPGMYPIGHGIDLPQTTIRFDEPETVGFNVDSLRRVDKIMREAVFDSTFPGGVVSVLKDGVIAYQKAFGYQTYDKTEKVETGDIYDLASLTKVIATTTATMKLVDKGKINLDDKVSQYIPEYKQGEKKHITIKNLLLHESGLPPFRVYVDSLKDEISIIEAIKNEPLTYKTGSKYVYSDLGFILLGEIIEKVTGTTLDKYLRKEFYYPLGLSSTFFNPARFGSWMKNRIPPTEIDTVYRNKLINDEVNDERAYYLNGVAGHAGLFSNAFDLSVYAQMLLSKGTYGGREYINSKTITKFTKRQTDISDRGYGFDHKSEGFSTAGSLASPSTFGHTGFTGTSIWIDPERNMAIIILTNRTYPHRSYGKNISKVRARVADAIISSLISE